MGRKRVHGCLLHVEIIDDKIWIQRDGTEDGIADELVEAWHPADAGSCSASGTPRPGSSVISAAA